MPKRWIIDSHWPGRTEAGRHLGVSPLVAQVLHNRGVIERDEARLFLNPTMSALHPPETLPGALQAADILGNKVRQNKRIVIYGDYDVDGITATSILWHLFTLAGADVAYYIPHRLEEGYGVNGDALRQLHAEGADTVITVDCGITAVDEARLARELGLTLIITDHHAPGLTLPEAEVIVHPGVGDGSPNPDLCGAGVAFKLAWALARQLCGSERVTDRFREFLIDATGLVALGTIADVVPLRGENRILSRFGLKGLAASKLTGMRALLESARLTNQKLESDHVGYWLAPRLNAAGRLGHAREAVELLTDAGEERAREIATWLEQQNRDRQSRERQIFREADELIAAGNLASDTRRAIVLASPGWHAGVIGIVASRVVDRYQRPAVMIAVENGMGQGSARSIRHFHLHQALADCADLLTAYGGHAMAAGLRIKAERIEAFTEAFVERANRQLTGRDLDPVLTLDAEIALTDLTEPVVRTLECLSPFGMGNPRPRFATGSLELVGEPRLVGRNGDHLQFNVTDGRCRLKAIAFRGKPFFEALRDHRRCRVACEPMLNTFNGRTSVELRVLDVDFTESGASPRRVAGASSP